MKLSEKILVIARWLENNDNELLVEAEQCPDYLNKLASSLVQASEVLKDVASEIAATEPAETTSLTPEKLEELAAVAASFDESEDELLKRQASVLDEILLTFAAPTDYIFNLKKAEEDKIDVLKKKYKDVREQLHENVGVKEALDAIQKSPMYKNYRPLEAPLSARTCLDHPGAQMMRVGDNVWQCSLDHKIYDYEAGFNTLNGDKIPPTSVAEQTPSHSEEGHQMFDTRPQRLGVGDR